MIYLKWLWVGARVFPDAKFVLLYVVLVLEVADIDYVSCAVSYWTLHTLPSSACSKILITRSALYFGGGYSYTGWLDSSLQDIGLLGANFSFFRAIPQTPGESSQRSNWSVGGVLIRNAELNRAWRKLNTMLTHFHLRPFHPWPLDCPTPQSHHCKKKGKAKVTHLGGLSRTQA